MSSFGWPVASDLEEAWSEGEVARVVLTGVWATESTHTLMAFVSLELRRRLP